MRRLTQRRRKPSGPKHTGPKRKRLKQKEPKQARSRSLFSRRKKSRLFEDRKKPLAGDNKPDHSRFLGFRLSAIIELVLFLAITLTLDAAFFGGGRFFLISPHPFWIIVLLLTVQYGTTEGILAALLCSAALLIGNMPPQTIDQDFYTWLLAVGMNPMMWSVTAVGLGELRNRYARHQEAVEQALEESTKRENAITVAYQELLAVHEKLEVTVAGELNTVVSMYRATRQLQNRAPEEVLRGAANVVEQVMHARKFSLHRLKENRLELALNHGWERSDRFETVIGADDPLFTEIVGRQRFLSVIEPEDEPVLQGRGQIAGPIFDGETGKILGMLRIEEIAFGELNFTALENFKVVCELLANAFVNASRMESLASESMVAESSVLLSDAYFSRQTAFLAALARRLNFPVSVLRIAVTNAQDLEAAARAELPAAVRDCTLHVLRSTDLAFEFRSTNWEYVIVLPNTPMSDTETVGRKFQVALSGALHRLNARFEISADPLVVAADETSSDDGEVGDGMEDYARQTQFLIALSRRAGFPIFGIRVTVEIRVDLPDELRADFADALLGTVRDQITSADLAFMLEPSGQVMAVLLPGVDRDQARTIGKKIRASVQKRLGDVAKVADIEVRLRELVKDPASTEAAKRLRNPKAKSRPDQAAVAGADSDPAFQRGSPCRPFDKTADAAAEPATTQAAVNGDDATTPRPGGAAGPIQ